MAVLRDDRFWEFFGRPSKFECFASKTPIPRNITISSEWADPFLVYKFSNSGTFSFFRDFLSFGDVFFYFSRFSIILNFLGFLAHFGKKAVGIAFFFCLMRFFTKNIPYLKYFRILQISTENDPVLSSDDLRWPREQYFRDQRVNTFILIYHLSILVFLDFWRP